eukprot:PhF_6_TR37164/c0_g1_i1/m.54713
MTDSRNVLEALVQNTGDRTSYVQLFTGLSKEEQLRSVSSCTPAIRQQALEILPLSLFNQYPETIGLEKGKYGVSCKAIVPINAGTTIFQCNSLVLDKPTVYTIMISPTRHMVICGGAEYLAHNCDPNVRVSVDDRHSLVTVTAIRNIAPEEILSFNYLTTEYDMDAPFDCLCGAEKCFGTIRGYKHLTETQKQELLPLCTEAVLM